MRHSIERSIALFVSVLLLAGCHSQKSESAAADGRPTIRIKAGVNTPFTDSAGHVWQAEKGFNGGDITDRDPDLKITNTKDPAMFRSEHFGMNSFTQSLPNGKYIVRLYFAETYEGITGAGQRVFSYSVNGHDFKDFDIFVKAGGTDRAYVETVPVQITDGKLTITFTANVENPEINAIEIIPAS